MKIKIAKDILNQNDYDKADINSSIAQAVSQLDSTHEAVFIFEDDDFQGVISLFHSFLGRKFSPEAKVSTCLYGPPQVRPEASLIQVAQLMIESRLYQLPVINSDGFQGIVEAEDVLKWACELDACGQPLEQVVEIRKPIFVDKKTSLAEALHLMINKNTNRLLVGDKSSLEGILTLYDLRQYYTEPQERITAVLGKQPIKKEFAAQAVEKFYQQEVVTIKATDSLRLAIKKMLENDIGSLVVLKDKQVVGLVTLRDLLKFVGDLDKEATEITFSRQFTEKAFKVAREQIGDKLEMLFKTNPLFSKKIDKIDLDLREIAKSKEKVRMPLLEVSALVRLKEHNQTIRTKVKGRRVTQMFNEVIEKIKRLLRQND
jgi:CBS domain-containing protein